jgi:hypothetical protein
MFSQGLFQVADCDFNFCSFAYLDQFSYGEFTSIVCNKRKLSIAIFI